MCLSRLLLREKSGVSAVRQLNDLMLENEGDLNLLNSTDYYESMKKIVSWLSGAHIMKGCGLVPNCNINKSKMIISKYYFKDVGFAYWLLNQIATESGNFIGGISENYVYIVLNKIIISSEPGKFSSVIPMYATYDRGEIDFFLHNRTVNSTFAIEVKYSGGETKSATRALEDGKVDFIVKAQGKGPFGIEGKTHTIPIYLFGRFNFDIASGKPVIFTKDLLKFSKLNTNLVVKKSE
jgi:predicted AAA+ superfamily ATPase